MNKPKVLILDIETSPLLSYHWRLFDENIALNQMKDDFQIIAWAAKWLDSPANQTFYLDLRNNKPGEDDKTILGVLWDLLDSCDIVVGHNSKQFDIKRINARFVYHGFKPTKTFQQIDTKLLAKKHFGFTSNKLEYLAEKLNVKYKKLKHLEFPGFELWSECLKGNRKAWEEMQTYNIHDVLATEEVYKKLVAWGSPVNFNLFSDKPTCSCGSTHFNKDGVKRLSSGVYQRYLCKKCGHETRGKTSLVVKGRGRVNTTR